MDDNDAARYGRSRALRRAGYEVIEASTGEETMRTLASAKPRLGILGIHLPDTDGFALCRRIKSQPDFPSVLVLQISASSIDDAHLVRGFEGGADGCLTEPVEPAVLLATVKSLLRLGEAEEVVRASAREWQTTFDAISDGIGVLDGEGRLVRCNRALERITGMAATDMAGHRWDELLRARGGDGSALRRMYDHGQRETAECRVGDRWLREAADPVRAPGGSITGAVCTLTDTTAAKHAQEQAERTRSEAERARADAETASRIKDEFLATVSHELRSPLNALLTWTHLLRGGTLDECATARALEGIERSTKLQTQLINDLLDVSRIISGKLRLGMRPVDLAGVIEMALETVKAKTDTKGIRVETQLDRAIGPVHGDPDRLQQVVGNLISNAIKFTPKGGRVAVQLARAGAQAQITVSDTGEGIAPEFLPQIFERFRQADASTTRRHGGLGLGLAIVHHLTELHAGRVSAASPGLGQGAVFTVTLPLTTAHFDSATAPVTAEDAPTLAGVHVLLVEDEAEARESVTAMLQRYGARVTAVGTVAEALSVVQRLGAHVLLSDIGMPGEDGYSLIRKVRALSPEHGGRIPAVALTAYAGDTGRSPALSAGFEFHITKPVDPPELVALIGRLAKREGQSPPRSAAHG